MGTDSGEDGPQIRLTTKTRWTIGLGSLAAGIFGLIELVAQQKSWQTKVDLDHSYEVEKQALRDDALRQRMAAIEALQATINARLDARDDGRNDGGRNGLRR